MASVLLATCSHLPTGDEDAAALLAALTAHEIDATWAVWDDPAVDWGSAPVVLRNTWDYTPRRAEFLAWAASVPVLLNPAPVVEWSSDKTYLRDLDTARLPVVPTAWYVPGEGVGSLGVAVDALAAAELVVKPSVGAGSRGAARFDAADLDGMRAHIAALHDAGRVAMLQPYLGDVDSAGETALLHFDATYSHAIRKGPMLAPGATQPVAGDALYIDENITPREPSAAELAVGAQVMRALRDRFDTDLLYARVDLLPTPDGPVIVELELVEPSLFLGHAPGAADRFAAALAARL